MALKQAPEALRRMAILCLKDVPRHPERPASQTLCCQVIHPSFHPETPYVPVKKPVAHGIKGLLKVQMADFNSSFPLSTSSGKLIRSASDERPCQKLCCLSIINFLICK